MTDAADPDLFEWRRHSLRRNRLQMIDGHLAQNVRGQEDGASVRVREAGYWGFAAGPEGSPRAQLLDQAQRNARAMARFGPRPATPLPGGRWHGEQPATGRPPLDAAQAVQRLQALHAWCTQRFPGLRSVRFLLGDELHAKQLQTGRGAESQAAIRRAVLVVTFVAEADDGRAVELPLFLSCKGSMADLELDPEALAAQLDELHGHVQAKRHAVPARGGQQTVVLAPALAGMLAHEAMGHPCEADSVLGGAITAGLLGQAIASPLVSMTDVAHTWQGQEAMMPVYVDDEGVPAVDAPLIDRGVLTGFMHSRETAQALGQAPTGSARAYGPTDEPLIRMRNTVIHPGERKLADMIAEVDDGYLLSHTANGQADATTEFMFGITLGYEIRHGRLGRAIRDTTVSGSALKVLRDVDAVSDDMYWTAAGYCGKKQPMIVSMGGPALRTRAHLGGE